jgi:hypothetical protein
MYSYYWRVKYGFQGSNWQRLQPAGNPAFANLNPTPATTSGSGGGGAPTAGSLAQGLQRLRSSLCLQAGLAARLRVLVGFA